MTNLKAELIDHMGNDLTVVNAARVSFNKESDLDEECLLNKDVKLIMYLAKHNHFTPFTHCMITMRETVPIFVARQRFKHTVGFSYNEVSRRYVSDEPDFFMPNKWRGKPTNGAKQGSSDDLDKDGQRQWNRRVNAFHEETLRVYNMMLEAGVAPEQARMVLPQSMMTSYYVTGSLSAWARAYKLRIDSHAQKEIQDLAGQWNSIIASLFPVSWNTLISQ